MVHRGLIGTAMPHCSMVHRANLAARQFKKYLIRPAMRKIMQHQHNILNISSCVILCNNQRRGQQRLFLPT